MEWEDFLPEQGDGPKAAIAVRPDAILPCAAINIAADDDGWYNVAVRELNEETARFALSVINDCEPEDIAITCRGTCLAV